MALLKRLCFILMTVALCVAVDQATKSIALSALSDGSVLSIFDGTIELGLTFNRGGAFSAGASFSDATSQWVFVIWVWCVLTCVFAYALFNRSVQFSEVVAVSLILGGGVGNFIDRLVRKGHVVDFITVNLGPVSSGIFNVADTIIASAFILLVVTMVRRRLRSKERDPVGIPHSTTSRQRY